MRDLERGSAGAKGWHPHTLVNAFPTGVKDLDRPNLIGTLTA